MIYMVTRERMGSPEAVVINFASITYHVHKVLPISVALNYSHFVSSSNEK